MNKEIENIRLSLSKNVHPNTDGSPWGWVVIEGTRIRVATYSGYKEQEYCEKIIQIVNQRHSLQGAKGEEKPSIEIIGTWQQCPKCNAQGTVSRPPFLSGDVTEWSGNQTEFECNVCNGEKIISTATGLPPSKNITHRFVIKNPE